MIKVSEIHSAECPLAAVDRRLEDLHRQWHEAEDAYFDPDRFRVAIQSAIQTLRTVTFILQSNKRLIPNFASWYQEWQDRLRADPLMRWMADARNKIEKQGDLEAHSYIRAEIVASFLPEGPVIQVPAKLFDSIIALIKSIPQSELGDHIRESGTLRIQRRWIENTLPKFELLDAVAIAYGRIAELVQDAHRVMGLKIPLTTDTKTGKEYPEGRQGRLPCMIGHGDMRTGNFSLKDGTAKEYSTECIDYDEAAGEESAKRYGIQAKEVFGNTQDNEQVLESLFKTARKMTETDGHHLTILFLLKGGKPVRIIRVEFENRGDKYLIMRSLAHDVIKLDADAAILIGESWSAPADTIRPYMFAVDSPERVECLGATLVRKEGAPVYLEARFTRSDKTVTLGDTNRMEGGAHYMFASFYEAWGRPIPDDWLKRN